MNLSLVNNAEMSGLPTGRLSVIIGEPVSIYLVSPIIVTNEVRSYFFLLKSEKILSHLSHKHS